MSIVIFFKGANRQIKREVLPLLLKSLKPLQPTLDELKIVYEKLREMELLIIKKFKYKELFESLKSSYYQNTN